MVFSPPFFNPPFCWCRLDSLMIEIWWRELAEYEQEWMDGWLGKESSERGSERRREKMRGGKSAVLSLFSQGFSCFSFSFLPRLLLISPALSLPSPKGMTGNIASRESEGEREKAYHHQRRPPCKTLPQGLIREGGQFVRPPILNLNADTHAAFTFPLPPPPSYDALSLRYAAILRRGNE